MSTPNKTLLWQTYEAIENDPDSWVQSGWRCRTGMCFAGHAAHQAGAHWHDEHPGGPDEDLVCLPNGGSKYVANYAQQVLGLSDTQAREMFDARNTLDDLKTLISLVALGVDGDDLPAMIGRHRDPWAGAA